MSKPRSHLLDIYDCWLHAATDRRQVATIRRRYGTKRVPMPDAGNFGGTLRFRVQPDDGPELNHYLIHLDVASHKGNQASLINTIAHEATHTAAMILDSTGTEYDGDSEPLAWLIGWLTSWLWEATT